MREYSSVGIDKRLLNVLNNLYAIEVRLSKIDDGGAVLRNVEKIKDEFEDMGLFYENPHGQEFKETRTDLEATISGEGVDNLYVVEVIKPIVRYGNKEASAVAQKGIVIVESKGA